MKTNILYIAALSGTLALSSCTDWLDVNDDPNNATVDTVTADLLLTSVENDIAGERAGRLNTSSTGGSNYYGWFNWSQQLTKSGDYSGSYVYLSGMVSNSTFNGYWANRYERIANIKTIKEKAQAEGNNALLGMAQVLEVIEFRELVDIYGNVPYTDAALAAENLFPTYDDAATIYKALCAEIVEAESNLKDGSLSAYGNADIYFGGDQDAWVKYANSIELSLLMRISNVSLFNEVNGATRLKALEGNCITENATSNPGYYVGENKMSPQNYLWGHTYLWNGNYVSGRTSRRSTGRSQYDPTAEVVKFLRDTENPLLRVYADPREKLSDSPYASYSQFDLGDEWYVGIPYGVNTPAQRAYVSLIGVGVIGAGNWDFSEDASKDVIIYPKHIVDFYFAEAALRGLIDGGDAKAKQYYEAGITSLMETYETALKASIPYSGAKAPISGTAAEAAADYYGQTSGTYSNLVNWDLMTTDDEKLEAISVQKWLGFFLLDPLESWSEIRRTDMPTWLHASHQWNLEDLKLPARALYPQTERALNADNFAANEKTSIVNDLIFWDTANPVREKAGENLNSKFLNGYEK